MSKDKKVSKEYLEILFKRNRKQLDSLRFHYQEILSQEESLRNSFTLDEYTTDKMSDARYVALEELEEQKKEIRDKAIQLHVDNRLTYREEDYGQQNEEKEEV